MSALPPVVQVALDAAEADGLVVTRYEADWGAFAFASGLRTSGKSLALLLAARFDLTWTRAPRRDLDAWWSYASVPDHYPDIYRDTIGRFPAPARDAALIGYAAELVVSVNAGRLLGSYPASVEPLDPPHHAGVRALLARAGWRESLRQSDNSPGSYRVWTHPDVVVPAGQAR